MDLTLLPENAFKTVLSFLEANDVRNFRAISSWANGCFLRFSKYVEKRPTSELCLRRKDKKTLILIISFAHITTSKWKLEFIDEENREEFNWIDKLEKPGNIKVSREIRGNLAENLSLFLEKLFQLTQLPGMIELIDLFPNEITILEHMITNFCDRNKQPTRIRMQISQPATQEIAKLFRITEAKTCSFEIQNANCFDDQLLSVKFFRSFSSFAIKSFKDSDTILNFDDNLLKELEMDRPNWGKSLNLHIEMPTRISASAAESFIKRTITGKNQRLWGSFWLCSPFPEDVKEEIFSKATHQQNNIANFGDICTLKITGKRISISKGHIDIL
ncbi:unnamed protein product, partial [Mesorhabditis belari]|uniref:F-box domain-containing protein n=1 Tax=Mesorhabditis belari TaxID=2138241 RepID=A0AAF3J1G5_9BILA